MPVAYWKAFYAGGSRYPVFHGPYPLGLCVVAWVILFSIVLAAIFSTAAFAMSISAAIASAFNVPRN